MNILHYQLCYTSGLHHNLTILPSAPLSNLQRIRRNFSGEDITASKALVCRTPQARHAPPTQDDGHPMPPVSPVCHRRPVIAVSTSSSFWIYWESLSGEYTVSLCVPLPHCLRHSGRRASRSRLLLYYPRTAVDKQTVRWRDQRGEAWRPGSSTSPACAQQRHHRLSTAKSCARFSWPDLGTGHTVRRK